MKARVIVGAAMVLVLGACPCLASLAAASAQRGSEHFCCPSKQTPKGRHARSGADCCLRAAAPSHVSAPAPDDRQVRGLGACGPELPSSGPALAGLDSGRAPPGGSPPLPSRSPRAPPAFAA